MTSLRAIFENKLHQFFIISVAKRLVVFRARHSVLYVLAAAQCGALVQLDWQPEQRNGATRKGRSLPVQCGRSRQQLSECGLVLIGC